MSNKARVLNHLQALSIPCAVYEHPAVFTMEECLALPYAAPDVTFWQEHSLVQPPADGVLSVCDPAGQTLPHGGHEQAAAFLAVVVCAIGMSADDAGAEIRELVAAGSVV